MKITAFSDTHGLHHSLKLFKTDMLVFAGDCMTCGYKEYELVDFLDWFSKQKSIYKIMIAGNHDRYIENNRGMFQELIKLYPKIIYLENSGIVLEGINIWGTPDSRKFCNWAFNLEEHQLDFNFSQIPDNTNILISHTPAFGIVDKMNNGINIGEKSLRFNLNRLHKLRYHISGHIHYAYGRSGNSMNVSVINEEYQLQNKPITFNY